MVKCIGRVYGRIIQYKGISFVVFVCIMTMNIVYLDHEYTVFPALLSTRLSPSENHYVDLFDHLLVINKTRKIILVWTTFFRSKYWVKQIREALLKCDSSCEVTSDRQRLADADTVLFHHGDIDRKHLPYKFRHQPWVLFTLEPTTLIEGNQNRFANLFNWTMSYRTYSTIFNPYGFYTNTSDTVDFDTEFDNRNKSMLAVVSRCHDDARRYKLIHELEKYFKVDVYGACSPNGLKCNYHHKFYCLSPTETKKYKFRLAFENSNCRDYITEKYWSSLLQGVIPIVNWKDRQKFGNVVPNSYINLFDFNNISCAASYIKKVSENKTLYSQYFEWKRKFRPVSSMYSGFCRLCDKLNKPFRAQVYSDLQKWFVDDTCSKFNVSLFF